MAIFSAMVSEQLNLVIHQAASQLRLRILQHGLQCVFHETGLVGQRKDPEHRPLPKVLMLEPRHRYIKTFAQPVFQAAQYLPLVFERMCLRKVKLQRQKAHGHRELRRLPARQRPAAYAEASAGAIFCTAKHSRMSPTFTSLKFDTPIPHSYPARTSVASSLNRRSECMRPVYTTAPSRTTRTSASRFT